MNAPVAGFDTDRETLPRASTTASASRRCRGGGKSRELGGQRLVADRARTGSTSTLAPGEAKTFVFILGYVENPRAEKWEKPGVINKKPAPRADRAVLARRSRSTRRSQALRDHWTKLLVELHRRSRATRSSNRMVNIWNPYQCMVTFNMSRSRLVLRDRHRPRHGLPRLEPGPARLRAPGAGARPRAHPRHRRRRSSPTAARTTSTSRSPSAATTTSAAASTTTRCG